MRKAANFWKYFIYAAMKVLFLTPWYPDEHHINHGIFVRDQALTIRQKHEVWVVSSKIDYRSFGFSQLIRVDTEFFGMKESRLVIKKSLPVFNQFNYFLRTAWETFKIARVFKPNIIHGNIGYPGAFWSWVMSSLLKIPFVLTEHTRITNNFRSFIHKHLTLFGLNRASNIIAVSHWHANEFLTFVDRKPVVIPNVINFEQLTKVIVLPDTDEFQIGFLGGMNTAVKGLDLLLQAIALVPGRFKLHIGGKGNLLENYKTLAKELKVYDKCIFYGAVPHEQVNQFMSRLHFFVSASRSETFGIAMVEALACGLPVIATDSGGPREFINLENGMIVPVENAEKLGEGILEMMKKFRTYNRELIRNQIIEKYSSQLFLEKIDTVYMEVIKNSKG